MKHADPALQHLEQIAGVLVDDEVGIVRYALELPVEAGSPNFFHFYARASNTKALGSQRNSADCGGAAADRRRALAKAIGEAVERYCSAIFVREEFPLCTFESASFPCISPESFAFYSPRQCLSKRFPFVPFEKSTLVRWVPALDLVSGQTWSVPASTVFVPYYYDREHGEHPISQPISTGLACHVGPMRAALSAACEVIERDAFTITWQGGLAQPKIDLETLSEANRDLVKRFEDIGAHVTLLYLRMDHEIPTIFSVLQHNAADAPALTFALSSHLDPEQAVRKSLEELAHSYRFCRLLKESRPRFAPTRNFDNVVDRDSHVALHCDHSNAHLAEFVLRSSEYIEFASIPNRSTGDASRDLETVIKRVAGINHRVLIADLTTDDVRELGLSVMRAVIPGFHPLCIGHRIRSLGGSRLWGVPERLGYRGVSRERGDNPVPHPLP